MNVYIYIYIFFNLLLSISLILNFYVYKIILLHNDISVPFHKNRPPLWSSGQEFLATDPEVPGSIPGTTKKVVGLERGPLSLVSTTEELLGRNNSGFGLESRRIRP
jgi:hypothetical protein